MNGTVEEGGRKITITGNLITILLNTYGPYAFGVVLFLVVWHTTIRPQLAKQTLDWQAQREIITSQAELIESLRDVSASFENIAKELKSAQPDS